jgi:hypothetical protein
MAAKPWGARTGRRVATVPPLAPPFSLAEPTPGLTEHTSLIWMGGEARAPPASSRTAVPPLPLRGSAAAESSPPLCWEEVVSGLGGASVTLVEGEAEVCLTAF